MNVWIIKRLRMIILFSCQPDYSITIQKYSHWAYDWSDENIDSKIVLVTIVKSRFLHILLNYVLILWSIDLTSHKFIFLFLSCGIWILPRSFKALFNSEVLVHVFPVLVLLLVQCNSQVLYFARNENSSTLRARFRLANEKRNGIILWLSLCHSSLLDFLFPFFLLLFCIFLDVVEFCRIHPCLWKEIEMVWKLFLKPFEMHSKRAFPADIIHTQIVISSLCARQTA